MFNEIFYFFMYFFCFVYYIYCCFLYFFFLKVGERFLLVLSLFRVFGFYLDFGEMFWGFLGNGVFFGFGGFGVFGGVGGKYEDILLVNVLIYDMIFCKFLEWINCSFFSDFWCRILSSMLKVEVMYIFFVC